MAFVYVHNGREILQKYLRNGLLPLVPQKINNNINIDISIKEILNSDSTECDETPNHYDDCVMTEVENLLTTCTFPFLSKKNIESVCRTFEDGKKALKVFNKEETKCKFPCYQINVDYQLHPSRLVFSKKNPNMIETENPSFFFNFPSKVKVSRMSEDYGIISYIAEFGGWSGLFIGISLLTITTEAIAFLNLKNTNVGRQTRMVTILAFTILTGLVIYTSVSKWLENDTGQDVSFTTNYSNTSFSICWEEPIFYNSSIYRGNDKEFWKIGSDIHTMLGMIEITFKNGSQTYWKNGDIFGENELLLGLLKVQNVLTNQMNIEFCQTLEIDYNIKLIKITTYKEVFLYVHMNKQFFKEKKRLPLMPAQSISTDNRKKQYLHNTLLNIRFVYKEEIESTYGVFDNCIKHHLNNTNISAIMQPSNNIDEINGIDKDSLEELKNLIKIGSRLCHQNKDILATYETHVLRKKVPIEKMDLNFSPMNRSKENQYVSIYLPLPDFAIHYKVN